MKKGEKKFDYIWDVIEVSVFIIVGYSLLDLVFSLNTLIDKIIPVWIFNALIVIVGFGTIGYKGLKRKESNGNIAKFGAYSGLIVGFIGAIIGILTFYFFPERIAQALEQAAQNGADIQAAQTFMKIGIYLNLIISPALNAGIGALIAWISALIFKKK